MTRDEKELECRRGGSGKKRTNLEQVEEGTGMQARLLVNSVNERRGRFGASLREQYTRDVEFETLRELVLKLQLGAQGIGGRPGLGGGNAFLGVGKLGFNVAIDLRGARVAIAGNAESNTRRGLRLHLEGSAKDGEVLGEKVIRALAEILFRSRNFRDFSKTVFRDLKTP
jgi:hypothetical protein